ncbi:MAG: mechanosensitive ion channel family protein [Lutibacter sp.]
MNKIYDILNYTINISGDVKISVKGILILIFLFILTNYFLKGLKKFTNKRLDEEDKEKFNALFSFVKYFVYILVTIIALDSFGIKISVLLAGSAALLVGLGLGLQTLFQDIISGIFILMDKTIHINDIIEVDDKIGKVFEINLRTTRALTVDDKVVIIPNHFFLTNKLYNWTQNGSLIIESVSVGVAYGSDVELVKKILIEVANANPQVSKIKKPTVLFTNFGDSALEFVLRFSTKKSFELPLIKSDLRFAINKEFKANNIQIPFPQRDIHIIEKEK